MASSDILQQHRLMLLCLQLFIVVALLSKGIAAPCSQCVDLKATDFLQCKCNFNDIHVYISPFSAFS